MLPGTLITLAAEAAGDPAAQGAGEAVSLLIVLAVAGLVALVMAWLRQPVVPAYLIAGVLIGPSAAGLVGSESVQMIVHLAIVLLMFGIGLHLDIGQLRGGIARLLGASIGSIGAAIALLWPLSMLLGVGWAGGLALAMAASLSSTAVVLRLLGESRKLSQTSGRLALAVLIVQDLAVIGMLMALPFLARVSGAGADAEAQAPKVGAVLLGGVRAAGAVAAVALVGRAVMPRLLNAAAMRRAPEVLMVVALAFALGAGLLTEWAGLSAELGAFLAGLLLASTTFRHQLAGQIGPMRDLFMAVFFTALGSRLHLGVVGQHLAAVLIGSVVLLVVKTACTAGACWASGATPSLSIRVGLWLAQGGEFGLVLLALATDLHLIGRPAEPIATAIIIVSLIATPPLFAIAPLLARRAGTSPLAPWLRAGALADGAEGDEATRADQRPASAAPGAARARVIVAGYGVVGRAVVDRLRKHCDITVIDMNPQTVRTQRALGHATVYGDVANPEVLEQAGLTHARALILTVPDEQAVLSAVKVAREMSREIYIVARTNYLSRGMTAKALGANAFIVEEIAAAEAMERLVANALAPTSAPTLAALDN